jgi:branched-chain amino acid transport system substrate-binding protein
MAGRRPFRFAPGVVLILVVSAALGCAGTAHPIRIGVLADCQGPLRGFQDGQLSGAELPFLQRGARLAGKALTDGVTPIKVRGHDVELVQGCVESGEHTVFIEEARRLVEREQVDAIVGGASVVAREVARLYPEVPFVSAFWDEQEVTLRKPASNLYRFTPDQPQMVAGLGAYAYRTLGWRRAAVMAPDQPWGWQPVAGFVAEFCALGGEVVTRSYRDPMQPDPGAAARALARKPDGVAAFLTGFDDPITVLGGLLPKLDNPARQLVLWAPSADDDALRMTLGGKLDGVASTSWLPAGPPSETLREYRALYHRSFPAIPAGFANQYWVMSYYDSVQALLTAIEHVDGDVSDGRSRLREELAHLRIELPDGVVHLNANRQAVRDIPIVRFVADAKGTGASLHAVRTVHEVEQSYGGLLSSAPPPSKSSQPCRKATPPPWDR